MDAVFVQAALDAATAGHGIMRPFSYQSAPLEAEGKLVRLFETTPDFLTLLGISSLDDLPSLGPPPDAV